MSSTADSTWSDAEPRLPTEYPVRIAWRMYARRLRLLGLVVLANVLLLLVIEGALHSGLPWPIGSFLGLALLALGVLVVYWLQRRVGDQDADKRPVPRAH